MKITFEYTRFFVMTKKSDLIEIKKNNVGTGLLIENDGYIRPSQAIIKENNMDGKWHVPYPFIVDAVFQKYGIKNANGRIYPEEVLKKQVELYQQKIQEHRAIGECYTTRAMVLAKDGWMPISQIKEGDEILTLNTDTNVIEVQKVQRKIAYDFIGDMIAIESDDIDDIVTPNHGYPIYNGSAAFKGFYTAKEVMDGQVSDQAHSYIPKQGIWDKKGSTFTILKPIANASKKILKAYNDADKELKLPTAMLMAFSGVYAACGFHGYKEHSLHLYISSQGILNGITEILDGLTLPYTVSANNYGEIDIAIDEPRVMQFADEFDDKQGKRIIPLSIKDESRENLRIFYDWFAACSSTDAINCADKETAMDICEILLKAGYNGQMYKGDDNVYHVRKCITHSISVSKSAVSTTTKYYDGKAMCLEVPNHTFYVMDGGKCHWSKNCNHPAESTIDLGRVSHNIIELHWEGHTLVGKMELNVSKGFVDHGICSTLGDTVANLLINGYKIGVSSRGVGSVEQKFGNYVVGDDFELICWDVVSDPSTNNAFITLDGEQGLQPYIESREIDASKDTLNEKISRINQILNE